MDLSRVQYVVIVYMENRSFDHILGYLNLPGNHPQWDQIDGIFEAMKYYTGFTYPPHPLTTPNIDPDPPHERENIALQINSAPKKMQGFSNAMSWHFSAARRGYGILQPEGCMDHEFPRQELRALRSLARLPAGEHFPNRLMAMSGYAF